MIVTEVVKILERTFYDGTGVPTAYSLNSGNIYLFSGQPVAYFSRDSIYSFDGQHLGRLHNEWVRDNVGHCVFFTENTLEGGPARPIKHAKPAKGARRDRPARRTRHSTPAKPADSLCWSSLSGIEFFRLNH